MTGNVAESNEPCSETCCNSSVPAIGTLLSMQHLSRWIIYSVHVYQPASKVGAECAQLFLSQCRLVLPLSICNPDSKLSSCCENERGFYVSSNNLNGFLSFSPSTLPSPLSALSEPGAIYLPVSNYSLVNTEKEAWKTVF